MKKTRQLYEDKEKLEYEDQRIYSKPVEEWEQETNRKIRQWINLAEPLTKKSIRKKRKRKLAADQPLISNIFAAKRTQAVPKTTKTYNRRPPRQNIDGE